MSGVDSRLSVVMVADTHARHDELVVPAGDVLVHAGDFTLDGTLAEVERFAAWLAGLPHRHKIVVAGNHDLCFQQAPGRARALLGPAVVYLEDCGVELAGVRFYGTPWQCSSADSAFYLDPLDPVLRERFAKIPAGTGVLITHSPPVGIGDRMSTGETCGCPHLLERVIELRPRLHVFGHAHAGAGVTSSAEAPGTIFVNAAKVAIRKVLEGG